MFCKREATTKAAICTEGVSQAYGRRREKVIIALGNAVVQERRRGYRGKEMVVDRLKSPETSGQLRGKGKKKMF